MSGYTEDHLIKQPVIQLMEHELGWDSVNAYDEWSLLRQGSEGQAGLVSQLGREAKREVVLTGRLKLPAGDGFFLGWPPRFAVLALQSLNPELPAEALDAAVEELTLDRSALSLVEANREIDKLLRGGVKVKIPDRERGGQRTEVVRVVDWDAPAANDFLLVSQFWISGDLYTRRTDLIGFVNGLPLVLIELKKPGVNVREAFDKNLADYRETIPQLFHYNGFVLVSNGVQSKIGTLTAAWEHFADWKKVAAEDEAPEISLNTLLRGTCEKGRLLDLLENYCRFSESKGAVGKLVARNHQFLGVNRAVEALKTAKDGRVGVFWHTQGSGKSYSMVFFAEKVFRKLAGNWTFVVITDRQELDTQIYRTFATCGAATEGHCQATSTSHLRKLLGEDHRYVFTLIHKFRTEPGTLHPVLSEWDDIIVLTDEAHRSQCDTLAMNMRTALPNAKFVAFTGTPLIAGEERTREVFGDYVSIYDFRQSVEDGATVPLFYENRTPGLQITNPELNDEIYQVIDEAGLDDDQEEKLKKVLGKRYHLITREERLDAVAKDIVHHFLNRGYQGKAMVVSIDKLTTLKMYEKVRAEWEAETARVRSALDGLNPQHPGLIERLRNLTETDMAVVVSPGQNEIAEMKAKGFDIVPHRERMVKEDLETKFKDPEDKFRLVFVCAMWLTGFDAPSCSTLYLDKPMRGHTLMQTIARANRVYGDKVNGLIVDYANVFQELEKALAIYGSGRSGGELPVKDKTELIEALKIALAQVAEFCRKQNVDLEAVAKEPVKHFVLAVNQLMRTDEVKDEFLGHARDVQRLYKAVMPDPIIPKLAPKAQVVRELEKAIRAQADPVDITAVLEEIGRKLDESILAEPHVEPGAKVKVIDLSQVDFEVLEKKFAKSKTKNLEAQQLRALIERKLDNMIRLNASRYDYLDRFQKMIEAIKKVCKELLAKLKTELLVLAWRNKRTTRAAVRVEIEKMLDAGLPEKYTADLFEAKCGALFQHVLEKYPDEGSSGYQQVG